MNNVKNIKMKNRKRIVSSFALICLLSANAIGATLTMDDGLGGGAAYTHSDSSQKSPSTAPVVNVDKTGTVKTEPVDTVVRPQQKTLPASSGSHGSDWGAMKSINEAVVPPKDPDDEIVMYAGEARILDVGAVDRVAIGNGKIASTAVMDHTKLLIIAQNVGLTNVLIWKKPHLLKEIRLRVTAQDVLKEQQDVAAALASLPNVKVTRRDGRLYLEGTISSRKEYSTIYALTTQYSNLVNTVRLDMKGIPVDKQNTQMLIFDLYFVEFKKGFLENLGVSWAESFNGFNIGVFGEANRGNLTLRPAAVGDPNVAALPPERQHGISAAVNAIIAVPSIIKMAVDSGDAFVLASPSIAAKNGGKASFVSGGEVPIPTVSQNGTNVIFKPYGVLIQIAPNMDHFGNITGKLKAEVSKIDPSVSVNGIPGFSTRRTESDFSVKVGDAIILSGLYDQEGSKDVQKVPFLGDVPIFGHLFKSTGTNRAESEVYMIAVPHLHDSEKFENSKSLNALNRRLNVSREAVGMAPRSEMPSIRDLGNSQN